MRARSIPETPGGFLRFMARPNRKIKDLYGVFEAGTNLGATYIYRVISSQSCTDLLHSLLVNDV